jgi:hypothetical protein
MPAFRITTIDNHSGKSHTMVYTGPKAEAKARNDWGSVAHSRFVRYAIWVSIEPDGYGRNSYYIKEIIAEIHSAYYLRDKR